MQERRLGFGVRVPGRLGPALSAALIAAVTTLIVVASGILLPFDQRLSDAWFSLTHVAPSGRIVLVTVDEAAAQLGAGVRLPRGELALLLERLQAAGQL